jgi:hypothetical protein
MPLISDCTSIANFLFTHWAHLLALRVKRCVQDRRYTRIALAPVTQDTLLLHVQVIQNWDNLEGSMKMGTLNRNQSCRQYFK